MNTNNKKDKTCWCGRCGERKPAKLMTTRKFCCCLSCEQKGKDAALAKINESPINVIRVMKHTVQHKKDMNAMLYKKEMTAIYNDDKWMEDF